MCLYYKPILWLISVIITWWSSVWKILGQICLSRLTKAFFFSGCVWAPARPEVKETTCSVVVVDDEHQIQRRRWLRSGRIRGWREKAKIDRKIDGHGKLDLKSLGWILINHLLYWGFGHFMTVFTYLVHCFWLVERRCFTGESKLKIKAA